MLWNVTAVLPLKFNVFSRKNSNFFMHQTNGTVIRPLKNGLPNFQYTHKEKWKNASYASFFPRNPSIFIDDALKLVETHRATCTGRSIKVGACNVKCYRRKFFQKKFTAMWCCFLCHLPNIRWHNVNGAILKILRQFFY